MKKQKMRKRALALCLSTAMIAAPLSLMGAQAATVPETLATQKPAYPYLDTTLSFEERAADLVSRMTLEEKCSQLRNGRYGNKAPAIPRLGVAAYTWWSEALHGIARDGRATSFPTGLGISATWDPELVQSMMSAASDEAREKFNTVPRNEDHGLSYWSPTINLNRDPRWGRAEESYGEDPFLTSKIAGGFVRGLQGEGEDDKYIKTFATAKHFMANNSESNRHNGNSEFDERSLREYYGYAFQQVVEDDDVESIMTSYNRVNGIPSTVNLHMLDDLLRRTWGFDGYVVTDCDTLSDIISRHPWRPNTEGLEWGNDWNELPEGWAAWDGYTMGGKEATALSLMSGTDANCGGTMAGNAKAAIQAGLMSEGDLDRALVRLFTSRMKSGEFDPDEMVKYSGADFQKGTQIQAPDHVQLAEDSSDQAVVLLKNETVEGDTAPILPLDGKKMDSVVVVGDYADEIELGDYSTGKAENTSTPLQGVTNVLADINPDATVTYIQGNSGSTSGNYLMNVMPPTFYNAAGEKVVSLNWNSNSGISDCRVEGNGNIGYVAKDGNTWVKFDSVDFSGVKTCKVRMAGDKNAAPSVMEIRVGSPSGQRLGSVSATRGNTGGWGSYEEYTFDMNLDGGYDTIQKDVYFVFNEKKGESGFSAEDAEKIKNADAVIAYVGTKQGQNGYYENTDGKNLNLINNQNELIQSVAEMNPRTIVYMQAVSQINIEPFKDMVPGIFWCTYNGQAQGNAVGRLVFGEKNPSAKLPFTWYTDVNQLADVKDYQIRSDSPDGSTGNKGRTYQYFTGDVTYPFGYGLSYSEFEYSNLKLNKTAVTPDDVLTVDFDVTNTSKVDGAEVAEVYITSPNADRVNRPAQRLRGFDKQTIAAGETAHFSIDIPMEELFYWDEENSVQTYDQGQYTIHVGKSSDDKDALVGTFNLTGQLTPELKTVTAIPTGHILDTTKPEETISTKLSASHNDQTFLDLDKAEVKYSSSKPHVASVNANGVVTAKAGGVATITVSVTENGVTKEDSYPVVVKEKVGATGLYLNGVQKIADFKSDKMEYTVKIENADDIPTVTAAANEEFEVEYKQASKDDLTATVKVSHGEEYVTYTVHFVLPSPSFDLSDFTKMTEEQVRGQWKIVRENDSKWNIDENGLTITMENGDLYSTTNTVKNLFVQENTPENWVVETETVLSRTPAEKYEQLGILAYQDDDNYIKLGYQNTVGKQLQLNKEVNADFPNDPIASAAYTDTHIWLRLQKEGNTYTGWYSADGENFKELGSTTWSGKNVKIAFLASTGTGSGTTPAIDVTYKYIKAPETTEKETNYAVKLGDLNGCTATYEADGGFSGKVAENGKVIFTVTPDAGKTLAEEDIVVSGTAEVTKTEDPETGIWTVTVTGAASDIELSVPEKEFDGNYVIKVNGEEKERAPYNTKVTVTAPKAAEGQKFAGWKANNEDSDFVSLDVNYTFFVAGNINLIPVYVDDDAVVEEKAQALLSNLLVTNREDGKRDAKFVGQLVLPKDYKLLDAGLIWSSKPDSEVELIQDGKLNSSLKPTYIKTISNTNQFSVTIKGVPADKMLRGKIFATVQAPNGNEKILVYSVEEGKLEAVK